MIKDRSFPTIIYVLILMFLLGIGHVRAGGDDCKGSSCDPHPTQAQACKYNQDNKAKCQDHPSGAPTQTPIPQYNPPKTTPSPIGESKVMPSPAPMEVVPTKVRATRVPIYGPPDYAPTSTPFPTSVSLLNTCAVSDDVQLLIDAINEGWQVVIVKDVLGTSPEVLVIGQ